MWPGPRFTSVPSGILIHPAVWPQQTWAKYLVGAVPFFWGQQGPHRTQSRLGRGLPTYHLSPSSRLATTGHWPKIGGGCAPLGEEELGHHLTQCRLG